MLFIERLRLHLFISRIEFPLDFYKILQIILKHFRLEKRTGNSMYKELEVQY